MQDKTIPYNTRQDKTTQDTIRQYKIRKDNAIQDKPVQDKISNYKTRQDNTK